MRITRRLELDRRLALIVDLGPKPTRAATASNSRPTLVVLGEGEAAFGKARDLTPELGLRPPFQRGRKLGVRRGLASRSHAHAIRHGCLIA